MGKYDLRSPTPYGHKVQGVRKNGDVYWTPEEDVYLRAHYGKIAVAKLSLPNRTRNSIISRANTLGLGDKSKSPDKRRVANPIGNTQKLVRPKMTAQPFTPQEHSRRASADMAMTHRMSSTIPNTEDIPKERTTAFTPTPSRTQRSGINGAPTSAPEHARLERQADGKAKLDGDAFQCVAGHHYIELRDLNSSHCRWPFNGKNNTTVFCGEDKGLTEAYCSFHGRVSSTGHKQTISSPGFYNRRLGR